MMRPRINIAISEPYFATRPRSFDLWRGPTSTMNNEIDITRYDNTQRLKYE